MDEILRKIEADEISILSSRSSDSVTLVSSKLRQYSIVPASHETSANLLKRVYRKTIHNIKLKARLNTIGEVVHRGDDYIPPDFFQDLLEVQRVGFFSESVRSQAWDLLLILLERRRTEAIINVIFRWPPLEARLFLHQLTLYRFTKWTLHPLRLTPVRNETKEDFTPSITGPADAGVVIAEREDALAFSYRNIIATLLKTNAPIVHEALSLDGYLNLQLPTISANLDDIASDDVLFRFFGYLFQHYEDTDNNGKQLAELPLLGRDLVHYASSGSPDCIERIVDYIVTSISTPTSKEADSLPQHVRVLLHERGQLGLPSNIHPVAPFLWFTIHLAIHSKTAFQLLMEEDLLQILRKIWATADDDVRTKCCILLGIISSYDEFSSLADTLRDNHLEWFLELLPVFVANYVTIKSTCSSIACQADALDERAEFYRSLLVVLREDQKFNELPAIWSVLIGEISNGRSAHIVDALLNLPEVDGARVFRQLVERRLSPRPAESGTTSTSNRRFIKGFRELFQSVHSRRPTLVYDCISVGSAAFVFSDVSALSSEVRAPDQDHDTLPVVFGDAQSQAPGPVPYAGSQLPTSTLTLVKYMSSVSTPFHHLRVVTQYCIRDTTQDPLLLIEFLTHWAYRSSRVSRVLLDEGVFDLIERTLNMETPLEIDGYRCNERMSQDLRITQVLILLTALAHSFPDDTVRALSSSNVKAKLQRDLLVVRTQFNLRHDDARMSSTDVLPILQSILFRSGCGLLESIPYSLRLIPGSGLAEDNEGALDSARELLKFCAIAPQESWVPTVLVESLYTNTGTLLNVMRYYSDVRQYPSTALSGARRRELLVFAHTSQAYGFDLINPLDRFVAFVVEAHTGAGAISERQLRFLYAEGGLVSLLDGLCAGDFDFVSEPTAEQRAKRSQNIEWLSTYMSLLSKYGDE